MRAHRCPARTTLICAHHTDTAVSTQTPTQCSEQQEVRRLTPSIFDCDAQKHNANLAKMMVQLFQAMASPPLILVPMPRSLAIPALVCIDEETHRPP
eukprot:5019907-Prymnesium_polylepis.1